MNGRLLTAIASCLALAALLAVGAGSATSSPTSGPTGAGGTGGVTSTTTTWAPTESLHGQACVQEYGPVTEGCNGSSLPGTRLRLTGPGYDRTATTDDWGSFWFEGPFGQGPLTLQAERAGFRTATIAAAAGYVGISLAPTQVELEGTVADATGTPMPGVKVWLCCTHDDSFVSGPDGAFGGTVPSGVYSLDLHVPGYAPVRRQVVVDGETPLAIVLAAMPGLVPVTGVVLDPSGAPVAGAEVTLHQSSCCGSQPGAPVPPMPPEPDCHGCAYPPEPYGPMPYGPMPYGHGVPVGHTATAVTGADGRFALQGYPLGHADMSAHHPDFEPYWGGVWIGEGSTDASFHMVRLPARDAHLAGRVVDAATGATITGYSLAVTHLASGRQECSMKAPFADSGTAAPVPQPASHGAADVAEPMRIGHPNHGGCALQVRPDGSFDGLVPSGYARIRVDAWQECAETRDAGGGSRSTCSPEYLPYVQTVQLAAGATDLVLRLQPRPAPDAVVSGYLVDATSERALPRGHISFNNEQTPGYGSATTDGHGSYSIRLRSGYHTVTVWVDGYYEWQGTLLVQPGENPFDVQLARGQSGHPYRTEPYWVGYDRDYTTVSGTVMTATRVPGPYGSPTLQPCPDCEVPVPACDGCEAGAMGAPVPEATDGIGKDASEARFSGQSYVDLGGNLGPYDPAARKAILEPEAKSSPAGPFFLVLVGLAGLLAWRRR